MRDDEHAADDILKAIAYHYSTSSGGSSDSEAESTLDLAPAVSKSTSSADVDSRMETLKVLLDHYAHDSSEKVSSTASSSGASTSSRHGHEATTPEVMLEEGSSDPAAAVESLPAATGRRENDPGAYAVAGFRPATAGIERLDIDEEESVVSMDDATAGSSRVPPLSNVDPDADLAVANVVEDHSQGAGLNLPLAEPEHDATERRRRRKEEGRRQTFILLIGVALFLGILIVLSVSLLGKNDPEPGNATEDSTVLVSTTASPQESATMSRDDAERALLLSWLSPPDYTVESLNETHSPQSKAFEWLLQDPLLFSGDQDTILDVYEQENGVHWRLRQRFALASLYFATAGEDEWSTSTNWLSYEVHECQWFAMASFVPMSPHLFLDVTYSNPCELSPEDDLMNATDAELGPLKYQYRHLWLPGNNLVGTVPPEISWLTSLRSISIGNNRIQGTIPSQFGSLPTLEFLGMGQSELTGTIPPSLGNLRTLTTMSLADCQFSGTIPSSLASLSRMKFFFLYSNQLTGTIPEVIYEGFQSDIRGAYFYDNQLTGTIATEIGLFKTAVGFFLHSNHLTGTIPTEIGLLERAERIEFHRNSLTGTLCTELGQLNMSLAFLEIQGNQLTGSVPSEMGEMNALTHWFAQDNQFSGEIPPQVQELLFSPSFMLFNLTGNDVTLVQPLVSTNESSSSETHTLCYMYDTYVEDCLNRMFFSSYTCRCNCRC